jgi:hypothetical protein
LTFDEAEKEFEKAVDELAEAEAIGDKAQIETKIKAASAALSALETIRRQEDR